MFCKKLKKFRKEEEIMKLFGVSKWGLNSNEESYVYNDNGVGFFEFFMFMSSKRGCKEFRSILLIKF